MFRFLSDSTLSGLFLIGVGSFAFWISLDYPAGVASQMESGYFPRLLSALLVILGVAVCVSGVRGAGERIEFGSLRPLLAIPASALVFGFGVQTLGIVVASAAACMVASLGAKEVRWGEALLVSLLLGGIAAVIFVVGLGLRFPIWPRALHG